MRELEVIWRGVGQIGQVGPVGQVGRERKTQDIRPRTQDTTPRAGRPRHGRCRPQALQGQGVVSEVMQLIGWWAQAATRAGGTPATRTLTDEGRRGILNSE